MKVKVFKEGKFDFPKYQTEGAAAMDVKAELSLLTKDYLKAFYNCQPMDCDDNPIISEDNIHKTQYIYIRPQGRCLIPTGLFVEIPKGYVITGKGRSGNAKNLGLEVHYAYIDNDFRNQIGIIIYNLSNKVLTIEEGDRLMQIRLEKLIPIEWISVSDKSELTITARGDKGFGHTGKK